MANINQDAVAQIRELGSKLSPGQVDHSIFQWSREVLSHFNVEAGPLTLLAMGVPVEQVIRSVAAVAFSVAATYLALGGENPASEWLERQKAKTEESVA